MANTQKKIKKLKIAIPKGRVLKDSLDLLRKSGFIQHPDYDYDSRRLIFDYEDDRVSLLIVKPWDVPTFVEYGAADAGISGKDVLLEKPKNVYEPLDLRIGRCRIVAAAGEDLIKHGLPPLAASVVADNIFTGNSIINDDIHNWGDIHITNMNDNDKKLFFSKIKDNVKKLYHSKANLRVATKYVRIARDFFNKKGVPNVQIIKLYGNVELAPVSGLCDFIVDLVSTGETLRQNNLMPIEDVAVVSSRLIVNRASLKINPGGIASLIDNLKRQVEKNADI
ncbi:MAG: ATP phosphoribosyltransferase [Candidatus Acidulodesulfobacterium ferriphilum]|uniref:ATP phosphoribosyltransferase n=1 Tax=Candidatus Acidulodesulfobacterium ferriphilum TaxID=2597223 RepID=A0A519B950_9DELT|nr:MAG: ATP phosphoribosyltransferase [Candidatus Acidulodesulfobacterium ferriphilum]